MKGHRSAEREVAFRASGGRRLTKGPGTRFCENLAAAGTAIACNLAEARASVTRKQMAQSYLTALREGREAKSSLAVLRDLPRGNPAEVSWLYGEADEFIAMLHVSVTKLQQPPNDPD